MVLFFSLGMLIPPLLAGRAAWRRISRVQYGLSEVIVFPIVGSPIVLAGLLVSPWLALYVALYVASFGPLFWQAGKAKQWNGGASLLLGAAVGLAVMYGWAHVMAFTLPQYCP